MTNPMTAVREALESATDTIKGITLGPKLGGKITEQEALGLINNATAYVRSLAFAALEALQQDNGWRPIESAPKDGTHILATKKNAIPRSVHWFDDGFWKGWSLSVNFQSEYSDHDCKDLTHWQPLPAAPGEPAPELQMQHPIPLTPQQALDVLNLDAPSNVHYSRPAQPTPEPLGFRFHKAIVNHSAPSGAVNMYELFDKATSKTWASVGIDTADDYQQSRIKEIVEALNQRITTVSKRKEGV